MYLNIAEEYYLTILCFADRLPQGHTHLAVYQVNQSSPHNIINTTLSL